MENNTRYQNSLLYISLAFLAFVYCGILVVAKSCYLPYCVDSALPASMFKTLWSFMIFPVIMISMTVFMANILNKKLKNTTVALMLCGMLFFSLIAFIYGKYDYTKASYFTSPAAFWLVFAIASCIIWDLFGGRTAKRKLFWSLALALIIAVYGFCIYILINYTVLTDLLGHAMLLILVPVFSALCFFVSIISTLSGAVSRDSVALCFGVSFYGTFYIAFPFMYHRPLRIVFTVGVIVCAVMLIYDIIKFITHKEKKENDR